MTGRRLTQRERYRRWLTWFRKEDGFARLGWGQEVTPCSTT